MKTLPSGLPVLTLTVWMERQTYPCMILEALFSLVLLPPLSQPRLLSLSEQRKGTKKPPVLHSWQLYYSFIPWSCQPSKYLPKHNQLLIINSACGWHIITPHLQSIQLSRPGLGAQLLWPWTLGLENPHRSCFAQYTCLAWSGLLNTHATTADLLFTAKIPQSTGHVRWSLTL